jgi:uncharacterized membrane protein
MTIFSLSTVFFFSISPVGGLLAAIVTGVGLGLHPGLVLLVSVAASALPALVIPPLCSLAELHPKVSSLTKRWRTEKAQQFFSRYGVWGMATLGRFVVGPYPAVMTAALFGVTRRKIVWVFVLGSLLVSLFFLLLTLGGFAAIR